MGRGRGPEPGRVVGTALVVVVAFTARLAPVLAGGGLRGTGTYDDGVYFTAALALVHGRLPYGQFVLLHPPGVMLVLAPFAGLASWVGDSTAFALARVAFMVLGTVTAVLVARLAGTAGRTAATTAGLAYAIAPAAVYAEHTTMLEGPVNLCLAAGLLVLLGRAPIVAPRAALAGALLGLGTTVKFWELVPLVVVAVWVGARVGRPHLVHLLAGAVAAGVVVCGPFFLVAPGAMVRYVLLAQLDRPRMAANILDRLALVVGQGPADAPRPVLMAVIVGASAVLFAAAWSIRHDEGAPLFLALSAGTMALVLASPPAFRHYGAIAAVPVSVVLGEAVQHAWDRSSADRSPARMLTLVAAAFVVVAMAVTSIREFGVVFPRRLATAAQQQGCVTADDPTNLLLLDTASRDLDRGCRLWVDVTGVTYDPARRTHLLSRADDPLWQQEIWAYLCSGDAAIITRPSTGLDAKAQEALAGWPRLARAGRFDLLKTPRSCTPPPGVG
ncbi:MAG: glycosyltransferase 87 family protein [Actinomycetes bacterium]